MAYAILEFKLIFSAVALYCAFLCYSFAAAVAVCLWSLLVHLVTSAAASLNILDGSVWTAFCYVADSYPAPSLQRRPAPAHGPCHGPAWFLFIYLPPSNLLHMCIQWSCLRDHIVKAQVNLFVIRINWGAFLLNLLIACWMSQSICWSTLLLLVDMLLISFRPSLSVA